MNEGIQSFGSQNNEENKSSEKLSHESCVLFKVLLLILIVINIFMLMFFGLNQTVLFIASVTLIIRMFIGLQNNRPQYFANCLFMFNMCFACHVIKIIFRFILTYFTIKKEHDITNLKDMNIIVTESILWIPGFDIKLNGIWSLIILIAFMVYWAVLIALFENKRDCFNYQDQKEYEEYLSLINAFYKLPKQLQVVNNQEEEKKDENNLNIS